MMLPACVRVCVCRREEPAQTDRQTDRQKQSGSRKREGDREMKGLAAFATAAESRS